MLVVVVVVVVVVVNDGHHRWWWLYCSVCHLGHDWLLRLQLMNLQVPLTTEPVQMRERRRERSITNPSALSCVCL